jgi:predicted phage gp36 major capsid-like protein
MENNRVWDGQSVGVVDLEDDVRRPIAIRLTSQAARTLIVTLGRLAQTTLPLPGEAAELKQALEYVLGGDAASTRAYRQMEAGKGMTPDGGYLAPKEIRGADGRSKL